MKSASYGLKSASYGMAFSLLLKAGRLQARRPVEG